MDDPFYDNKTLDKKFEIDKNRSTILKNWGRHNNLKNDTLNVYNWYINKVMKTIPANGSLKYKVFFNPKLKLETEFVPRLFYFGLENNKPYKLIFRIIRNKKLYDFLTREQKKKFKNLFIGTLESDMIHIVPSQ